jgi:DNA-binding CsgD family transcriptional regulator
MRGIADGLSRNRIAKDLGITPSTVRTHVENVLAKLHCHSQAHAVAILMRMGMIR